MKIVEFPLEHGGAVLIETADPIQAAAVRGVQPAQVIDKAKQTFDSAISKLTPIAECIIKELTTSVNAPSEITVEFGIKMNAEAGVVLAKSSIEANFKVTLTWKAVSNHLKEPGS